MEQFEKQFEKKQIQKPKETKKEADPETGFECIDDLSDDELKWLQILAHERADSLLE